jgi:hypothetical protein
MVLKLDYQMVTILEETASYYVMAETKTGGYTPALITMKSTQLNVSKKWNSMMKTIQIPDGKGGLQYHQCMG